MTQLDFYTFFRELLRQISFLYFPDRGCDPNRSPTILPSQKILRGTLPSWKKSRGEINIFSIPISRSLIFKKVRSIRNIQTFLIQHAASVESTFVNIPYTDWNYDFSDCKCWQETSSKCQTYRAEYLQTGPSTINRDNRPIYIL